LVRLRKAEHFMTPLIVISGERIPMGDLSFFAVTQKTVGSELSLELQLW
jgi:hypothetical protein